MFRRINRSDREKCLLLLENADFRAKDGWWGKYPGRAAEELCRISSSTNAIVTCRRNTMIFKEEISNNFGTIFVISIEVQDYPFKMPKVFLEKPKLKRMEAKHMWKDGSLCVLDPDDYHSSMSILEIRNLAAAWCFCAEVYANSGEWPAAEH